MKTESRSAIVTKGNHRSDFESLQP